MNKLTIDFYKRKNVIEIARDLLGKIIVTKVGTVVTSGRIVETEAYMNSMDRASHAWEGKRTLRNEHMYAPAGTAYIYICYGIHQMLNVVTNEKDVPDAVLIRAIEPLTGLDMMMERTGKHKPDYTITKGPGNVGKALGIHKNLSGVSLMEDSIFITADDFILDKTAIGISKRIGVDYAGADALLPYRFYIRGNKYVSGKPVV